MTAKKLKFKIVNIKPFPNEFSLLPRRPVTPAAGGARACSALWPRAALTVVLVS